jgi:hypothetical protein
MPVRTIDRNSIKQDEDWEGNNAALTLSAAQPRMSAFRERQK